MATPSAPAQLRHLLHGPGMVIAPGCHDALGARLVENTGFAAVYMSGNATSASRIGRADLGLLTMSEMVQNARGIAAATRLPLISDADTGYGDEESIARTVHEFEAAGVAAIHIEDQAMPKRCGAMPGLKVVDISEAEQRIKVALQARTDPDFLIIARTDALALDDYKGAIERARAFAEAGADMVVVEDPRTREDVETIARDLADIPLMTNVFEAWPWTLRPARELEDLGYKLAIYCLSLTLAYTHASQEVLKVIRDGRSTSEKLAQMASREGYEAQLGLVE